MTNQDPQVARYFPAEVDQDTDLSLRRLFLTAWRGRWILTACVVLGVLAGVREIEREGEIWRAQSRVFVLGRTRTPVFSQGFIGSGTWEFLGTQAAVLQSTKVLQAVAARPDLALREFLDGSANKIAKLRSGLKVEVGKEDDVLTVSATSKDVGVACVLVNSVVDEYRRLVSLRGENSIKSSLAVYEEQRRLLQLDLDQALEARDRFLEGNSLVALDPEGAVRFEVDRYKKLRLRLDEAEEELDQAEARLAEAELFRHDVDVLRQFVGGTSGGLIRSAGPPEFQQLLADISADEAELDRLRLQRGEAIRVMKMTPQHSAVVELDRRIAEVSERLELSVAERDSSLTSKAQSDQRVERLFEVLNTRVAASRELVARERARSEEQRAVAKTVADLQAQYDRLEREVERSRRMVEEKTQKIRSIDLSSAETESLTQLSVEVLDPARPDTAQLANSKSRTLAQFLILGLLAGGALTWFRALLDQRLRSESDLARAVPSPLIGVIPRSRLDHGALDVLRSWVEDPRIAEAARGIRTAIYSSLPAEDGNVIQITSPEAADGKSTSACYLAVAQAKAGQSVVLVDADLRSPSIHSLFHRPNDAGLSEAIRDPKILLNGLIQRTELGGLDLMTSGASAVAPAEMLNSKRFDEVLESLAEEYDAVIVDSPPLLAVADARIVATRCDATILVTRVDRTKRGIAAAAYERVQSVGGRVLGVVMNAMPSGIGYGYGYGYGYGESYGYGDAHAEEGEGAGDASGPDDLTPGGGTTASAEEDEGPVRVDVTPSVERRRSDEEE